MKIKYKIALLFTVMVILIYFIVGFFIYSMSTINRKSEFSQRIRNRALTSARLLVSLKEINQPLLRKIDSLNFNILTEERISVYNENYQLLYRNNEDLADPFEMNEDQLQSIREKKSMRFSKGEYEGIGVLYHEGENNFVVTSSAIDQIGRQEDAELKELLFYGGLTGIIIAMLAGYFFSVSLLRPLNLLNNIMKEISVKNISHRITLKKSRDELDQLSETFNDLLSRLEIAFENEKRFIANASHELATPLAAVSSQLEVALMQDRSVTAYKKVMSSVQEDVAHLNGLVKKLLELTKAGSGKGITLTEVRLDEIVLLAAEETQALNNEYKVSVAFEEPPEDDSFCCIFGNTELLFIAFRNIIENACKYSSSQKAMITVSMKQDKKTIKISDEGIGIKEEDLEKIFEPFYRSSEVISETQGAGLGLSLASKIIRLHKGNIQVSTKLGKGTTFSISFAS